MLRDARYILKGGFIPCSVYRAAASTLLHVSGIDISLAIFLINFYICVKKQVGRDYIQQNKVTKCNTQIVLRKFRNEDLYQTTQRLVTSLGSNSVSQKMTVMVCDMREYIKTKCQLIVCTVTAFL